MPSSLLYPLNEITDASTEMYLKKKRPRRKYTFSLTLLTINALQPFILYFKFAIKRIYSC